MIIHQHFVDNSFDILMGVILLFAQAVRAETNNQINLFNMVSKDVLTCYGLVRTDTVKWSCRCKDIRPTISKHY